MKDSLYDSLEKTEPEPINPASCFAHTATWDIERNVRRALE